VVASGETELQEEATSWKSRKGRIGGAQIGYSGQAALRREQCDGLDQRIARQRRDKHLPA
jgi:hypothetical protein